MPQDLSISNFTGQTENGAASTGSTLNTGDLRRKYNFGTQISSLAPSQDAFYTFMAGARRDPTDDSQFKFAEERPSWFKRYAYVVAHGTTAAVSTVDATLVAADVARDKTYYFKMGTDYKYDGNIGSRYGNSTNEVTIGDAGTKPAFFIPGLLLKINTGTAYNSGVKDYIVVKIEEVTDVASTHVILKTTVVRGLRSSSNVELQWKSATAPMDETYTYANVGASGLAGLESKRCYVVGNAFGKGTGYPETWADNPYTTGYGLTQIWKTALGMDNSSRAHVLKYASNEWMRIWGNKLKEHKWDIAQDLYFSSQYIDNAGVQYTQGAVDYILNYGTTFQLNHGSKTCDDFLNDMSQFTDPRYNAGTSTVYFCDTNTYNWLNKLSGYFNNNININTATFRADFAFKERVSARGVAVNRIETIYGDMNVVRDIHLDGSGIAMLAINMNNVRYRPLVGNGINRDTSVYVGVQTLENSGVDKRVDLILTEAGAQFTLPETHAIWVNA